MQSAVRRIFEKEPTAEPLAKLLFGIDNHGGTIVTSISATRSARLGFRLDIATTMTLPHSAAIMSTTIVRRISHGGTLAAIRIILRSAIRKAASSYISAVGLLLYVRRQLEPNRGKCRFRYEFSLSTRPTLIIWAAKPIAIRTAIRPRSQRRVHARTGLHRLPFSPDPCRLPTSIRRRSLVSSTTGRRASRAVNQPGKRCDCCTLLSRFQSTIPVPGHQSERTRSCAGHPLWNIVGRVQHQSDVQGTGANEASRTLSGARTE